MKPTGFSRDPTECRDDAHFELQPPHLRACGFEARADEVRDEPVARFRDRETYDAPRRPPAPGAPTLTR